MTVEDFSVVVVVTEVDDESCLSKKKFTIHSFIKKKFNLKYTTRQTFYYLLKSNNIYMMTVIHYDGTTDAIFIWSRDIRILEPISLSGADILVISKQA